MFRWLKSVSSKTHASSMAVENMPIFMFSRTRRFAVWYYSLCVRIDWLSEHKIASSPSSIGFWRTRRSIAPHTQTRMQCISGPRIPQLAHYKDNVNKACSKNVYIRDFSANATDKRLVQLVVTVLKRARRRRNTKHVVRWQVFAAVALFACKCESKNIWYIPGFYIVSSLWFSWLSSWARPVKVQGTIWERCQKCERSSSKMWEVIDKLFNQTILPRPSYVCSSWLRPRVVRTPTHRNTQLIRMNAMVSSINSSVIRRKNSMLCEINSKYPSKWWKWVNKYAAISKANKLN